MSNLIYLLRYLNKLMNFWSYPKSYSKPSQTSKMEIFARIVLTIFAKNSIFDVPPGSGYASAFSTLSKITDHKSSDR